MSRYNKRETIARSAIIDADWLTIDALLRQLPDASIIGEDRNVIARVHAIKVAISTRHYSQK